ncbi:transglutaminase TgpA family protein [Streptomyces sp. MAR4 CNX-425]|uniref:transglutaminase TgpA family protein n=1 Tax=Streptomyces sp. MAR4 CNX-425 TaxID=3406343 RepID=UPI003B50FD58
MSGRARLTVCAAAASLLAATALLPLTDKMTWFFKAIFLVSVIGGVGMAARRIPLPRPLTVLAQTAVTVLLLTMLFAGDTALGGVVPGPAAIEEFRQLFQEGGDDVSRYSIPAPVTDGIELMLLSGVAGVALLVDAVAVTFRSAAPAGLPLLALYSVAAGLNQGGSWLTFLLAGAGYLLLLLAEGRDRLAQWGRMFGGGRSVGAPGAAEPGGGRPVAPVRTGRRIGAVALGFALVVPAALPSLDGGLLDGKTTGPGDGPGGGTVTAINPVVRLQQSLNQPENREVFRYRSTDDTAQNQALYMRFVALDRFDGTSWRPSRRSIQDIPDTLPPPQGYTNRQVASDLVTLNVRADDDFRQQWLPMPYPAYQVRIGDDWRYEPEGRSVVGNGGTTTGGAEYQVTSLIMEPTAEQLANAPAPDPALSEEYTQVPDSLPDEVREQARELTRGAANDYERALDLQDFFTTNFVYDTETDLDASDPEAILKFLQNRQGFCVHFSFTMAAMARTLGIPARVAVGFVPGTAQGDGSMSVGLQDAHAWPELYFEGAGWTRFEPTPTRGTLPDYTLEDTPAGGGDPAGELPDRGSTATPVPSPSTSEDECPAELRRVDGCPDDEAAVGGAAGPADGGPPAAGIAAGAAGVLLLLLLPALPALWRVRERGRRLRPGAGPLAAWREMIDAAWDFGLPPDESQTPRTTAAALIRFGSLDGAAAQSALRVAGAVEQTLYAPRPRQTDGLAEDVRRVRVAMGRSAGVGARLRAAVAPRSAARLTWAVTARWAAVTGRWREAARRAGAALRPSRP